MCYSNNIDINGWKYGKWQIMPGFWVITNRWQNFMYLLVGEHRSLLIDSGYGEGNLREFVEEITEKPIMVINTHGHFDHTGGNGWWPEVRMAQSSYQDCRLPFEPIQEKWFSQKPYKNFEAIFVSDGDILELGNHEVEVISIPAHHDGSIALLDRKFRVLFTGDELESGQVLLFVGCKNSQFKRIVSSHKANMEKLKARRAEYDFICPAHNGCMLYPDAYLDDFIALDQQLLNETARIMPNTAGFGYPCDAKKADSVFKKYGKQYRAQYGLASIVYLE